MRVAVTGTPGTGKTSATEQLDSDDGFDLEIVHLNDTIREEEMTTGRDCERDTLLADLDAIETWLDGREDVLFESHLAHQFPADRVVVLRCHPETLERRLEERGESDSSVAENAESEALDIVLAETVEIHDEDSVYEIDTTDRSPTETATAIADVVADRREPSAGTVSFVEYL